MEVIVENNYEEMSNIAASLIAEVIKNKPNAVVGLPTGSTPLGTYKELIRMHKDEGLDFSKVITFNLDEYVGLSPGHPLSYHCFMQENLFRHINIKPENIHIPDGVAPDIVKFCEQYENDIKNAGSIDIQLLGIGANGHIAFNEPGSSLGSLTRVKTLDSKTIEDNSRFFNTRDEVPKYAITMGIGTIMGAKKLILLASGRKKAAAIARTVEGPITAIAPSTIVQLHPKAIIIIDKLAAAKLTRKFPAVLGTLPKKGFG